MFGPSCLGVRACHITADSTENDEPERKNQSPAMKNEQRNPSQSHETVHITAPFYLRSLKTKIQMCSVVKPCSFLSLQTFTMVYRGKSFSLKHETLPINTDISPSLTAGVSETMRLLIFLLLLLHCTAVFVHASYTPKDSQPNAGSVLMAEGDANVQKWPRYIYYQIPEDAAFNDYNGQWRTLIDEATQWFSENTCIYFEKVTEAPSTPAPLMVFNPTILGQFLCVTTLGLTNPLGANNVHMGCAFQKEAIIQQIAYSLGLVYEHQRFDRDQFVVVDIQNASNSVPFDKKSSNKLQFVYDMSSLMQPGPTFFSKDGGVTIRARNQTFAKSMGSMRIQGADMITINKYYNCAEKCIGRPVAQCKNNGIVNPNKCQECLCLPMFTGPLCGSLVPPITTSAGSCGGSFKANTTLQTKTFKMSELPPNNFKNRECFVEITKTNTAKPITLTIDSFTLSVKPEVCTSGVQMYVNGEFSVNAITFCDYAWLKSKGLQKINSSSKIILRLFITGQNLNDKQLDLNMKVSFVQPK